MRIRIGTLLPYLTAVVVYASVATLYHYTVGPQFHYERGKTATRVQREYYTLNFAVKSANAEYRALMVEDTVSKLLPNRPGAFVRLPQTDSGAGYLLRKVEQAANGQPLTAAVGVIGIPMRYGSHPAITDFMFSRYFMFGVNGTTPYCVTIVPTAKGPGGSMQAVAPQKSALGPCRFWARYGAPSAPILNWMDLAGRRFARSETIMSRATYEEGRPFFMFQAHRWWATLRGQKCLGGDLAVCEYGVLRPPSNVRRSWFSDYFEPSLFYGEANMLWSLERQFGRERFSQFWHSQQPVPQAFEAAFGVSLGQWVHDWSTEALGPLEAGPGLSGATIFLSLLIISLCAGSVVGIAKRRAI